MAFLLSRDFSNHGFKHFMPEPSRSVRMHNLAWDSGPLLVSAKVSAVDEVTPGKDMSKQVKLRASFQSSACSYARDRHMRFSPGECLCRAGRREGWRPAGRQSVDGAGELLHQGLSVNHATTGCLSLCHADSEK